MKKIVLASLVLGVASSYVSPLSAASNYYPEYYTTYDNSYVTYDNYPAGPYGYPQETYYYSQPQPQPVAPAPAAACPKEKPKDVACKEKEPEPCKPPTPGKFRFGADVLYWEAVQGQLAIGNEINVSDDGGEITNKIIRPRFGAKTGFRVNAGYDLPGEGKWDVNLNYIYIPFSGNTALFTTENDDLEDPNNFILLKTLNYDILATSTKIDGGEALSAKFATMQGFWKGHNDVIALTFGRKLKFLNDTFTLKPTMGISFRWGEQHYDFGGVFLPTDATPDTGTTTLNIHLKEHFLSVAGLGGFGMTFDVGCGFSIVGNLILSASYTNWTIHQKGEIFNDDPANDYDAVATETDKFPSIGFGYSYFAGVEYSWKYCSYEIKARLGWENLTLQQNVLNSIGANLGFQGISAGLQVSF